MEVSKIIKAWLEENGFDGLYIPGECACVVDDLLPCGEPNMDCCAGYKRKPESQTHEFDFIVGPEKQLRGRKGEA